ncbi:hypothetical protein ALI44B_04585 [Leifsonia sp. ALI-44-B]|uniref:hypothetical protein n=1 Tax=Leifsonia sp. ALI-44-B TaxID=1933776 RepID=UPI00097C0116|nr:hypothetical protein [Leifsonia sp. ALI-44-B]ONI63907.1 hypothetical protein ALI44B_04585 [Leifsonia sp. ALI-44-B]
MAASNKPRHVLERALKPLVTAHPKWRIIPYQRNVDALSGVIVMLKQKRITRLPEAPDGLHAIEFTATIVSPKTDTTAAEDELDDGVNALIHELDLAGIGWADAEKVKFDDQHLAYDITLTVTSNKE